MIRHPLEGCTFRTFTEQFAHAALVSLENEEVVVMNVTCAYLNAVMPNSDSDKLIFVQITSITVHPFIKKFVITSGTLVVEIDKAFYGFIELALLW